MVYFALSVWFENTSPCSSQMQSCLCSPPSQGASRRPSQCHTSAKALELIGADPADFGMHSGRTGGNLATMEAGLPLDNRGPTLGRRRFLQCLLVFFAAAVADARIPRLLLWDVQLLLRLLRLVREVQLYPSGFLLAVTIPSLSCSILVPDTGLAGPWPGLGARVGPVRYFEPKKGQNFAFLVRFL